MMNQSSPSCWSPMVSAPEEDFTNFLDFGDAGFSAFDTITQAERGLQPNDGVALDTSMEGTAEILGIGSGHIQQPSQVPVMNNFPNPFQGMNLDAEAFPHHQQQQQMHLSQNHYFGQNVVPPTPNSMEMHGSHGNYFQSRQDAQQQQIYEHYKRHQRDQINFTPLVSPAVTPLDTQFQYSDYAASTDNFTPLTSPALRAQNQNAYQCTSGAVLGSDTSDTNSPIDPTMDRVAPTSASTANGLKPSRRRQSSSSTKIAGRAVRQSPAMKPHTRRKQPSSTIIPPKEIAGIIEEARKSNHPMGRSLSSDGKLHLPYSQDSSDTNSVSPEPLSEVLMPPPATPRSNSAGKSPHMVAKTGDSHAIAEAMDQTGEPATPASLMKIRRQANKASAAQRQSLSAKEQALLAEADMERIMEGITLPDSVKSKSKPSLKPIDTGGVSSDQSTPTLSARTPGGSAPSSAPVTSATSAFPSPATNGMRSPTNLTSVKRGDLRSKMRDTKRRTGGQSSQMSPALRPKISPNIKPLLPDGGMNVSAETSALLLASKSNYQNILEGTHLPGVRYPETLSTNLTSKRTSHKIAEQGRRNRINTALQEIASLLPPQTPPTLADGQQAGEKQNVVVGGSLTTGSAAQQSNSKASTVELAIEYIRTLKAENQRLKDELGAFDGEKEGDGNETAG